MKRYAIVVLALGIAFIAAGMVFFYTQNADERVLSQQQPVDVLVSTARIPQGMTISEAFSTGLAKQTQIPSSMTPEGSVRAVTAVNEKLVAVDNIAAGQILLAAAFAGEIPKVLAVPVPDGKIAISVTLGDPQRVGTFVRPGSEVVIFDTYTNDRGSLFAGSAGGQVTRVLLDRVTVLAVGDATVTPGTTGEGAPAQSNSSALLTLALTQTEAEKLIHGVNTGNLYLGLLGSNTSITNRTGATSGNLFS